MTNFVDLLKRKKQEIALDAKNRNKSYSVLLVSGNESVIHSGGVVKIVLSRPSVVTGTLDSSPHRGIERGKKFCEIFVAGGSAIDKKVAFANKQVKAVLSK